MQKALDYCAANGETFVSDLIDILRIPSISPSPAHVPDMLRCAEWIVSRLTEIGMKHAQVVRTEGHPLVYAEHIVDANRPTVLAYAHYDVQPPEPLAEWTTGPFDPDIRDGAIYARGACDDKGQMLMIVSAIRSYLESGIELPVNIKCIFEGEEETSGESVATFIAAQRERLSADAVLICDMQMPGEEQPAITVSLRGITYLEVVLEGSSHDLHSGAYGGAVPNPINVLAKMLGSLKDDQHRVTVPGFYDEVQPIDDATREALACVPFDEKAWLDAVGVGTALLEPGVTAKEATTLRPTLDVHGIWGGYSGDGSKTIIPASAGAKLSSRLVANQTPADIIMKISSHLESMTPKGMRLSMKALGDANPVSVDPTHPAIQAALLALRETFPNEPVLTRTGGSIPAVNILKESLQTEPVLMGFGLSGDRVHAPDEHFGVERFRRGIESVIRFFAAYGS